MILNGRDITFISTVVKDWEIICLSDFNLILELNFIFKHLVGRKNACHLFLGKKC